MFADTDAGQFRRQIGELPRHEMRHLAFSLDWDICVRAWRCFGTEPRFSLR